MPRTKGAVGRGRTMEAERLREILKPIHDKLKRAGLSEAALPTNDALVSKLLDWVDNAKIDAWVKQYVKLYS